jgi:hypothetical protein
MVNPETDRMAIDVGEGNFVVADLLGGSVDVEEILEGALSTHGSQTLRRASDGRELRVFIEAIQATYLSAKTLTFP